MCSLEHENVKYFTFVICKLYVASKVCSTLYILNKNYWFSLNKYWLRISANLMILLEDYCTKMSYSTTCIQPNLLYFIFIN